MKSGISILFFLAVSVFTINANAQSNELDLFILAGQSNAQGWKGDGAQYPEDPDNVDAQILLNYEFIRNTTSNGWITMQPQDGRYDDGHFGPEVSFSRRLKQTGYTPAIFKFTKGATSLYDFWKTPGQGGQYDQMVINLKEAISELETQGYQVNVRGFIWIQGESDTAPGPGEAYFANLSSIISNLRSEVDNSSLPILLGVDDANADFVAANNVIPAQQAIAANDSFIKFTSMVGLPKADGTHLTPEGLVQHGERLYDAMADLLSAPPVTQDSGNLALSKAARQSSTAFNGIASRATDGNTDGSYGANSVSHTDSNALSTQDWWEVDLGAIASIDAIQVWNRSGPTEARLSDFTISISPNPFTETAVTELEQRDDVAQYVFSGTAGRPSVITTGGQTGRYVRLQLNSFSDPVNLAEIQVNGTFVTDSDHDSGNLALNKNILQSSTAYGGVASRANDGNVNGNYWGGLSVAHTNPDTPAMQDYLEIDLGEPAAIENIRVWNRTDCCTYRLSDFNVFVSMEPFQSDSAIAVASQRGVTQLHSAGEAGRPTELNAGGTVGRYIRLQLNSYADTINLSELEVIGTFVSSDTY